MLDMVGARATTGVAHALHVIGRAEVDPSHLRPDDSGGLASRLYITCLQACGLVRVKDGLIGGTGDYLLCGGCFNCQGRRGLKLLLQLRNLVCLATRSR